MAYWLFQGNPKYYRVLDAIRDFEQMLWLVTRYGKDMAPGDGVLAEETKVADLVGEHFNTLPDEEGNYYDRTRVAVFEGESISQFLG